MDSFCGLIACVDRPIVGFGPWAKDNYGYTGEFLEKYGTYEDSLNYYKAMEMMGTDISTTIFIGDQLFTDVYGARRTGIYSVLTSPIDKKEEIQIVLKRYLEKIVLYFYRRAK
jgi:ribonucleotide monophosphatase NagD (HAD superfamily)